MSKHALLCRKVRVVMRDARPGVLSVVEGESISQRQVRQLVALLEPGPPVIPQEPRHYRARYKVELMADDGTVLSEYRVFDDHTIVSALGTFQVRKRQLFSALNRILGRGEDALVGHLVDSHAGGA